MPEVTGDISMRAAAAAAAVSPHLCKNSPAPLVLSSRTSRNNIVVLEMVPYLGKNSESDRSKRGDPRGGCGGEGDGSGTGVAIIFFL